MIFKVKYKVGHIETGFLSNYFWFWMFKKGICINNLTGHTNCLLTLTLLPNGLLASGSQDFNILIWDTLKTYPLYTITAHSNSVRALLVIDNKLLASASDDGTIKLWSVTNFFQLKSWQANIAQISSLAFDPTIEVVASGDQANMVKVWDSSIWTRISIPFGKPFFF